MPRPKTSPRVGGRCAAPSRHLSRTREPTPCKFHFKLAAVPPRCRRSTGCPTPARAHARGAATWGSRPCECTRPSSLPRAPPRSLPPNFKHPPARSEPDDIGDSGLLWLFLSYGYVLYFASNLISEGSDLLLLVPSIAGIVGSCVLPVLGAVPDGAIMLFSGLGDVEEAQENLAVGVGALAGSTIMLLTVPWALSLWAGRVDLDAEGKANYARKPKLGANRGPTECGVSPGPQVKSGANIMVMTLVSYVIIQGPAFFMAGDSRAEVAENEKSWALLGLVTTLGGFVSYLYYQGVSSHAQDVQKKKQEAVMKTMLASGRVSL